MKDVSFFLSQSPIAVAGASTDRSKYGNIVFRTLVEKGFEAIPLNPNSSLVEGKMAFPDLMSMEPAPLAVSVVTPPGVTMKIVEEAIAIGVQAIWMQPGAENAEASRLAREAGIQVIDDGSCILVALATIPK